MQPPTLKQQNVQANLHMPDQFPLLLWLYQGTIILNTHLSFCGPKTINHFYCTDPLLLMLTCSDTYMKQTALFVYAGFNLTVSLLIILISYTLIFISIMRICSRESQCKAFSTCDYGLWLTIMQVSGTRK